MTRNPLVQLGEPVEHGGVVVAPLFPRLRPQAYYVTLDQGLERGLEIREVSAAGSVPEVLAVNPTVWDVLVMDGEELAGAKQDRILNVTVLLPARSETRIPVSCVEQGRWSARSASFAAALHAAPPAVRARKAERLLAAPLSRGVAQSEVWDAVAESSIGHGARSLSGAQADVFAARRPELASLAAAFPLEPGQAGALLALGPDRLCLDYVSRPEAFARLYPKLLAGYLLDALALPPQKPAAEDEPEAFLAAALAAPRRREPSAGLGDDVRLSAPGLVGGGLELGGELLQLSAFALPKAV